MEFWGVFKGTAFVAVWFSWAGALFALIPVGAVKLVLKANKTSWRVPPSNGKTGRLIPCLTLGLIGGLAGEYAAVGSLSFGEWWICKTQGQLCYDGQGGLVLIFTLPVMSLFGSALALGWTWVTLLVPSSKLGASIFSYSGQWVLLNWLVGVLLSVAFWWVMAILAFRGLVYSH